jgi:NTP pyrophosphatase (non-canonical NTP hydrolase)
MMNINDYQREASTTAKYPLDKGLEYCVLGLTSEAGEVAGKLKKYIRDDDTSLPLSNKRHDELVSELGDVLWYVAMIAKELNVSLNEVALNNISKLKDRQQRDVISGDGDNR